MELSVTQKLQVIKNKLQQYQAGLFSLKLDYEVAEVLEDENMKTQLQETTKKQLQAVKLLQEKLDALTAEST